MRNLIFLTILLLAYLPSRSQMYMESDTVIRNIGEGDSWREVSKIQYFTSLSIYSSGRVVLLQGDSSLDMKTIGITVKESFVRYDFQFKGAWFCLLVQKDFSFYSVYYKTYTPQKEYIEIMLSYPVKKIKHSKEWKY